MMKNNGMTFQELVARGDWQVAAGELAVLPVEEVAARLECLPARERAQLFALLPPARWARVFAALQPAKQTRELVHTLAQARG